MKRYRMEPSYVVPPEDPVKEYKVWDQDYNASPIPSAGTTLAIPLIGQGTAENQRVGRECTLLQFHMNYLLWLPALDAGAVALSGDCVRMMLVLDKQCNGVIAKVEEILESTNYLSMININNRSRFDILWEKWYDMIYQSGLASDNAGLVSHTGRQMVANYTRDMRIPIRFNGTVGLISEITSSNLVLLYITQGNRCNIVCRGRASFVD